ncbi:FtsW/RodA/SpoVE family cell cycle protein [Peribacillus sp. NPDC060253]|uniref:FtsW/RodA/SpoVE family cell cycle protein n=1 Tax=Peribacillus sp. NPDC060253 TaxID=3347084 RepID=UPI003663AA62
MIKRKSYFDSNLAMLIIILMVFSSVSLYSAQKYAQLDIDYFKQQIVWFVISGLIVLAIFYFDFETIMKLTPYIYSFGIFLLLFVLLGPKSIAPVRKGAKSWIEIPGLGSIQPSEFMKIFLILMLSYILTKHIDKFPVGDIGTDCKLLFKMGVIAALPIGLTLLQNDFGTSLVMAVITMGIVLVSGINWKMIASVVALVVSIVCSLVVIYLYDPDLLLNLLDGYQLDRINSWLDPFSHGQGIGYQLKQSILAIGSGMTEGKGFNQSNVYIPEAHTDFIFTIVAEEFGFIGASLLISLYFFIIYKIVATALNSTFFESFICVGVISFLTFHIFQNIGMVIGLIPITGIPLPLMSYGGSSVMATMMGLGLVLNVSLKKRDYMFSNE